MFITSVRTSSRWSWKARLLIMCDSGHTTRSFWRKSLNSMNWTFLPLHADHMQRPLQVNWITLLTQNSHIHLLRVSPIQPRKYLVLNVKRWCDSNSLNWQVFLRDMFQVFWIPIRLFLPVGLSQETIVSIRPPRWRMLGESFPVRREMLALFDIFLCPHGFKRKTSQLVF